MSTSPSDPHDGRPIVVHLDAGLRLVRVEVESLDPGLRRPESVIAAFDAAYSQALVGDAVEAAAASPVDRTAPRAPLARAVVRSRPPIPEPSDRAPQWALIEAGAGSRSERTDYSPEGRSGNDCVGVRLDPASSRGRLTDLDSGWLSQTTPSRLEAAITEAFTSAYDKRRH